MNLRHKEIIKRTKSRMLDCDIFDDKGGYKLLIRDEDHLIKITNYLKYNGFIGKRSKTPLDPNIMINYAEPHNMMILFHGKKKATFCVNDCNGCHTFDVGLCDYANYKQVTLMI